MDMDMDRKLFDPYLKSDSIYNLISSCTTLLNLKGKRK